MMRGKRVCFKTRFLLEKRFISVRLLCESIFFLRVRSLQQALQECLGAKEGSSNSNTHPYNQPKEVEKNVYFLKRLIPSRQRAMFLPSSNSGSFTIGLLRQFFSFFFRVSNLAKSENSTLITSKS